VPVPASEYEGHEAVEVVWNHLSTVFPAEDAKVLLKWLAHNVQFPGRKIRWAVILKGVEGDGKSTVAKLMRLVMGTENVKGVNPQEIFSDFTGWAAGAALRVIEEIRIPNHNRQDAMNKLKEPIANDDVRVVRKAREGEDVINTQNYIAFTNHEDALALNDNDRRWFVSFSNFEVREELLEAGLDNKYFSRLNEVIEQHFDVLSAWLRSINLSGLDIHSAPPITDAKRAMLEHGRSSNEAAVIAAIKSEAKGVFKECIDTRLLNDWLRMNDEHILNTKAMGVVLGNLGYEKRFERVSIRGDKRTIYVLKTLRLNSQDKIRDLFLALEKDRYGNEGES